MTLSICAGWTDFGASDSFQSSLSVIPCTATARMRSHSVISSQFATKMLVSKCKNSLKYCPLAAVVSARRKLALLAYSGKWLFCCSLNKFYWWSIHRTGRHSDTAVMATNIRAWIERESCCKRQGKTSPIGGPGSLLSAWCCIPQNLTAISFTGWMNYVFFPPFSLFLNRELFSSWNWFKDLCGSILMLPSVPSRCPVNL